MKECPACGQAYEHVFTVYNLHVVHPVPFTKRVGAPMEEARMNSPLAMATGDHPRHFVCETKEAFDFLKGKQEREEMPASAIITMKDATAP